MIRQQIETIILAGGKGTRLKGVLDDRPKPMAVIIRKPFIEWILLMLKSQGIHRVVICTGYLGEVIESYFENNERVGMEIKFVRDPFPLGTGGAVRNALNKTKAKTLLVLNGDSFFRFSLSSFLEEHLKNKASVSICLMKVDDSNRYGSVEVNRKGEVLSFAEKHPKRQSDLINSGIYLIKRKVIESIPQSKMISLEENIFPNLIGKGLYGVSCKGPFIDIGTPESFNKAEKLLKSEFKHLLEKENL